MFESEEEVSDAFRRQFTSAQATEAFLQNVVAAAPSALVVVDAEGRIVLTNSEACRTFGFADRGLLGLGIEQLVPADVRPGHAALRAEYWKNPTARKMGAARHLLGQRKDGSLFPIEVGLNPITTHSGRFVLCAIVDRSLDERYEQQILAKNAELERINEELQGFSSAASHDLKAPLRAIQNTARWLEEDLPIELCTPEVRESLRLMKSRAGRMEGLLDALLEYSRATRQKTPTERFETSQIVDNVVLLLGQQAERCVRVEGELPTLHTPRVPFQQVLFNLIWNALKHGARTEGLSVLVRGGVNEFGRAWFSIEDNGPGIDPQFHERIFEVFLTIKPRDEVEGAGMGLALVKRLVEAFGGKVNVESALGRGAIFRFDWPLDSGSEADE